MYSFFHHSINGIFCFRFYVFALSSNTRNWLDALKCATTNECICFWHARLQITQLTNDMKYSIQMNRLKLELACASNNQMNEWSTVLFRKTKRNKQKTNAKGGVAAWPDVQKSGATLGNLTPADRHGSVQVCPFCGPRFVSCFVYISHQPTHHQTRIYKYNTSPSPLHTLFGCWINIAFILPFELNSVYTKLPPCFLCVFYYHSHVCSVRNFLVMSFNLQF